MKTYPNLLLIAGTGRNTGKTSLACSIIKKISKKTQLVGLKISPHFHGETEGLIRRYSGEGFNIYEETSKRTGKDSSLMLNAGASRVYYIETEDNHLLLAFEHLQSILDTNIPLVCESPGLGKLIKAGVFIITDHNNNQKKKKDILQLKEIADIWINDFKREENALLEMIKFSESEWKLNNSLS